MIQTGHKFAHAMTAQLSWHVLIDDPTGSLLFMTDQQLIPQDLDDDLINCSETCPPDATVHPIGVLVQWPSNGSTSP